MSSIPTTGRSPEFLARQFGFGSVDDMAKKLKPNAVVFDIGAGTSTLGNEIVVKRSDIIWTNIDPCYNDPDYANHLTAQPGKVNLLAIDICSKTDIAKLSGKKADYVLSYWLLPHLSTSGGEPAIEMAKSMHSLLTNGGVMIVGPVRKLGIGLLSPWRYKSSISFTQSDDTNIVAKVVLKATKLWWLPRFLQSMSNKHNLHFAKRFVGAIK